jgi:hypothetical protein
VAKRKGVNSRKKNVQRKKKVASKLRRVVPVIGICCGVALLIGLALYGGKLGYGKLVAAIDGSSFLTIKKITVTGNEHVAAASIVEQCNFGTIRKLYHLKPDSIVALLNTDPWISRARCVKRWWGEVVIDVRERKPVALIHSGAVRLVDEEGVILPVEPGKTYELPMLSSMPVVKGGDGRVHCDSTVFERARRLITTIGNEDSELLKSISQMDMQPVDGARCRFAASNADVIIGADVGARQLRNLRHLLGVLDNEGSGPKVIDMRYQNLAFVKNNEKGNGGGSGVN